MSSAKWRPICLGPNVLTLSHRYLNGMWTAVREEVAKGHYCAPKTCNITQPINWNQQWIIALLNCRIQFCAISHCHSNSAGNRVTSQIACLSMHVTFESTPMVAALTSCLCLYVCGSIPNLFEAQNIITASLYSYTLFTQISLMINTASEYKHYCV